jgi:chromate transporter
MVNLATFVGTRVAGFIGAIFATLGLIVIPFLTLYVISLNYAQFKNYPLMQGTLKVIRPMAIGFITVAIMKLFKTSITDLRSAVIAIGVILLTYGFKVNPIYTVLEGIVLGVVMR